VQGVGTTTSLSLAASGSTTKQVSAAVARLTWSCTSQGLDFSAACRSLSDQFRSFAANQTVISFPSSWQSQPPPEKKSFKELAAIYAVRNDSNWPIARAYLVEQRKRLKKLERFARRELDSEYPYLILDARYEKVRENGVIRSDAVLVAIGINWEGRRQLLAMEMANRESSTSRKRLSART
jgi:hypothetical protein